MTSTFNQHRSHSLEHRVGESVLRHGSPRRRLTGRIAHNMTEPYTSAYSPVTTQYDLYETLVLSANSLSVVAAVVVVLIVFRAMLVVLSLVVEFTHVALVTAESAMILVVDVRTCGKQRWHLWFTVKR